MKARERGTRQAMPVDEGVVAALEGALERDPENDALAVHLAQVLMDAGRRWWQR